jgi:hypothetical protein
LVPGNPEQKCYAPQFTTDGKKEKKNLKFFMVEEGKKRV